jgi:hypothetical protein
LITDSPLPFDCVLTVSLSEFRAYMFTAHLLCLFAEVVEDTVGAEFIPFVLGTGLRVTIAESDPQPLGSSTEHPRVFPMAQNFTMTLHTLTSEEIGPIPT